MSRRRRGVFGLALGACGFLACTTQDIVAIRDCSTPLLCESDQLGYCAGQGPPAELQTGATCAAARAAALFQRALCLCGDAGNLPLTTDGFDSAAGPYMPGGPGGDVAVNGGLATTAPLSVGGSLRVGGSPGVSVNAGLTVREDLLDNGPLGGTRVDVGRNAQVASDISLSDLAIAGTLTLPATANLSVSGQNSVGMLVRQAVTVAPPCACAPADLLDVPGLVQGHRTDNDNAAIGLDPNRLVGLAADATLELPCGRYFLNGISGNGALTLRTSGRVALYVQGEISLSQAFRVQPAADSELDLFLDGRFDLSGPPAIGSEALPARVRFYIGNTAAINFSAPGSLGGNFYAPQADLSMSATVEVFGSLQLHGLVTAVPFSIHYDSQTAKMGSCP